MGILATFGCLKIVARRFAERLLDLKNKQPYPIARTPRLADDGVGCAVEVRLNVGVLARTGEVSR